MTKKDVVEYWQKTANEDLGAAEVLISAKKYHQGLFFCHIALEKLIKGLVFTKTKKHPFPIHNLYKLAKQAQLKLSENQQQDLEEITTWNIRARYDSYKREFYKKATRAFTLSWLQKSK